MTKIITCGKCDKSFWCLFLAYFIITLLNSFCHIFSNFPKYLNKKEYILIRPFLIYFGQLLMFFYELIFNKITLSKIDISSNYKEKNESNQNKKKKKTIIIFGTICTLLLLIDTYKICTLLLLFTKFSYLNFIILIKGWTFVFLFLIIINTYYLKINIYIHQKFAIFIIIILGFASVLIGIIFKKTIDGEDYVLTFIRILVSFAEAFIIILIKDIMENKFYSPIKVCYLIGLINFIISFIILFILSFIKYDSKIIFDISFNIEYKGVLFFILFVIVFSLINGISRLLINIILNKYSILHLSIFFKIDASLDLSLIIIDKDYFKQSEQYNYIIELFLQLIEYLMYLVFLEIIELNFCGLNKYLKNNIQNRAIDEYKEIEKEEKGKNDLKFNFD